MLLFISKWILNSTLPILLQAIVFYELAAHFNPHCAEACNNLGVIYKDRDNLDKAVECYQVNFCSCEEFYIFFNKWITILAWLSFAILQLALSIKPTFSQSLNNLGVVYTVQVYIKCLLISYIVIVQRVKLIIFAFWQGKMDEAAAMIEKAIIANPTYAEAYNNLGLSHTSVSTVLLSGIWCRFSVEYKP